MGWLNDSVSLFGFIGAILVLTLTVFVVSFYVRKMKTDSGGGELTHHEWDGIREFKNDIPIGWLVTLMATIIWAIWYIFFGYPLNSYSQLGEYNDDLKAHNEKFEKKFSNMSNDDFIEMGEQIFLVQCAQCHGLTAEGNNGKAQNLTLWGKEEGIIRTIKFGSSGGKSDTGEDFAAGSMPAGLLDDEEEIKAVAAYIIHTLAQKGGNYDAEFLKKGEEIFADNCSSCHGDDGGGGDGLAANLSHYGKMEFLKTVLEHGKRGDIGHMPSFKYLGFNDIQLQSLNKFIESKKPIKGE